MIEHKIISEKRWHKKVLCLTQLWVESVVVNQLGSFFFIAGQWLRLWFIKLSRYLYSGVDVWWMRTSKFNVSYSKETELLTHNLGFPLNSLSPPLIDSEMLSRISLLIPWHSKSAKTRKLFNKTMGTVLEILL